MTWPPHIRRDDRCFKNGKSRNRASHIRAHHRMHRMIGGYFRHGIAPYRSNPYTRNE
jgi:hypothetical protein